MNISCVKMNKRTRSQTLDDGDAAGGSMDVERERGNKRMRVRSPSPDDVPMRSVQVGRLPVMSNNVPAEFDEDPAMRWAYWKVLTAIEHRGNVYVAVNRPMTKLDHDVVATVEDKLYDRRPSRRLSKKNMEIVDDVVRQGRKQRSAIHKAIHSFLVTVYKRNADLLDMAEVLTERKLTRDDKMKIDKDRV